MVYWFSGAFMLCVREAGFSTGLSPALLGSLMRPDRSDRIISEIGNEVETTVKIDRLGLLHPSGFRQLEARTGKVLKVGGVF